jgi:hypothetical protein
MSTPRPGDRVKLHDDSEATVTGRALVNGKPVSITVTPDPNEIGEPSESIAIHPTYCVKLPTTNEPKEQARVAIDSVKAANSIDTEARE